LATERRRPHRDLAADQQPSAQAAVAAMAFKALAPMADLKI
jgi:hypothetical protein